MSRWLFKVSGVRHVAVTHASRLNKKGHPKNGRMPPLKVRGARLTNDFLIFRVKGDFCDSFARSKIFFIDLSRRFWDIDHFHTKTENRKSFQKRPILLNKSYCGKKKIFFEQGRENTQFYSFYLNLNVCPPYIWIKYPNPLLVFIDINVW